MKIRKAVLKQDVRNMPIDHGDMFLLSQVEDLVEMSELLDVAPWQAMETERRLSTLVQLGLLEWVNEYGEAISLTSEGDHDPLSDRHVAVTLRPAAPLPVADLFRQTETSVVALRTGEGLVLLDQAVIHHDRSVFSRVTLVDEDPESRSRDLNEAS